MKIKHIRKLTIKLELFLQIINFSQSFLYANLLWTKLPKLKIYLTGFESPLLNFKLK